MSRGHAEIVPLLDSCRIGAAVGKCVCSRVPAPAERWPSGRRRSPAKRVNGLPRFEGSNPSLSVLLSPSRQAAGRPGGAGRDRRGAGPRLPTWPTPAHRVVRRGGTASSCKVDRSGHPERVGGRSCAGRSKTPQFPAAGAQARSRRPCGPRPQAPWQAEGPRVARGLDCPPVRWMTRAPAKRMPSC